MEGTSSYNRIDNILFPRNIQVFSKIDRSLSRLTSGLIRATSIARSTTCSNVIRKCARR